MIVLNIFMRQSESLESISPEYLHKPPTLIVINFRNNNDNFS